MRSKQNRKLAVVLVAYTIVSGSIFSFEFQSFERSHANSVNGISTYSFGALKTVSLQSARSILHLCDQELTPPISMTKTSETLLSVARHCEQTARNMSEFMPTDGFAFYVAALSLGHLNREDDAARSLEISAKLAPFEGWLAQRRLSLGITFAGGATSIHSDIDTLLSTQSGSELLAKLYAARPSTRLKIRNRLEKASVARNQRFLNLLKLSLVRI